MQPVPQATDVGQPKSAPSFPFPILFSVWALVAITAILVTLLLPVSFSSKARIRILDDRAESPGMSGDGRSGQSPSFIQTEMEVMQSELVLGRVIELLQLNKHWGDKYAGGEMLKTTESLQILRPRLDLRHVRNTSLIVIQAYSDGADEAANIANALADAYRDFRERERLVQVNGTIVSLAEAYRQNQERIQVTRAQIAGLSGQQSPERAGQLDVAERELNELERFGQGLFAKLTAAKTDAIGLPGSRVEIIDRAFAEWKPVRPNKPLNITIGIVVGGLGGLLLSTLAYGLECRAFRRRAGLPRAKLPSRLRAIAHILIALVVGVVVGYYCAAPLNWGTIIAVPLAFLLGGLASAFVELVNATPITTATPTPGQAEATSEGAHLGQTPPGSGAGGGLSLVNPPPW